MIKYQTKEVNKMTKYHSRIYILVNDEQRKAFIKKWGPDVICATRAEIEKILEDYTKEEIKDIERSRIAGIHSHILVINIAKRKANKEEKEVNLYSELDLPIEITHILVKAGIRTYYDLLLKSIEEISNIPGMTKSKLKIIMKELEKKEIFLMKEDPRRLATLEKMKEDLKEEIENIKRVIQRLEEKKQSLERSLTAADECIKSIQARSSEEVSSEAEESQENAETSSKVLTKKPRRK